MDDYEEMESAVRAYVEDERRPDLARSKAYDVVNVLRACLTPESFRLLLMISSRGL